MAWGCQEAVEKGEAKPLFKVPLMTIFKVMRDLFPVRAASLLSSNFRCSCVANLRQNKTEFL